MRMTKYKERWIPWLFFLPGLLGTLCFSLLPMVKVLISSFQSAIGGSWQGLSNYRAVFENKAFQLALANTAKFTAVCIPLLILLSLALALMIRKYVWGGYWNTAFLMPMAVPAASVVLVWRVLFHNHGLLNRVGSLWGLRIDWMESGAAFWMLVISYLWKNTGYTIILWTAALAGIPESIYEAAQVDGAKDAQVFSYITLPNLKPAAFTIIVLSLLNSFKVFREAWLVAGDYPHESMYLLQHLYNNWFRELDFDKIAAASVLTSLVVFLLIVLLQKTWDREV